MPNEFQGVIDSILKGITFLKFFLDDILLPPKELLKNLKQLYKEFWKHWIKISWQ